MSEVSKESRAIFEDLHISSSQSRDYLVKFLYIIRMF